MFFDKFKVLCEQKGVSCNKAITEMGLSNSVATKWKKTEAVPNVETLSKIAAYFGITMQELLPILSNSQQAEMWEIFESALNQKDLTCGDAIVLAKCKSNFFPRLKNGSLSIPPEEDILRVAELLDVVAPIRKVMYVYPATQRPFPSAQPRLSLEEKELVDQYRSLDEIGRDYIRATIHAQVLAHRERINNHENQEKASAG